MDEPCNIMLLHGWTLFHHHETYLVSISSYVTSPSLHHRSQEVFQSKNPHSYPCAFLTLKQKISSFCIIFTCTYTPHPMLRLFLETHTGTSGLLWSNSIYIKYLEYANLQSRKEVSDCLWLGDGVRWKWALTTERHGVFFSREQEKF